jgi:hypothetical protein
MRACPKAIAGCSPCSRYLLDQHMRLRYRLHDLIGAFARDQAPPRLPEWERAAALRSWPPTCAATGPRTTEAEGTGARIDEQREWIG